jgi:hypothetical protein
MFEFCDRNRDGKLCPVELQVIAAGRKDLINVGGNSYAAMLTIGPPTTWLHSARKGLPAREATPRPLWFTRMDRNQDGVVSDREFLGPREHFQAMDASGDCLVDPDEATSTNRARHEQSPQP